MKKRVLSLTLVLVMLAVVLPGVPAEASGGRVYLEDGIRATETNDRWRGFPANGSFLMYGELGPFFRGITGTSSMNTTIRDVMGTYDIAGRGFVRLSGWFGYVPISFGAGIGSSSFGTLTITCADTGRFIGGADVNRDNRVTQVNIAIENVQRITVHMRYSASIGAMANVGFGDAFFTNDPATQTGGATTPPPATPPTTPNLDTAAEWARSGIQEAHEKGIIPQSLLQPGIGFNFTINRQDFCRMAVRWVEFATGRNIDTILAERGLTRNPNAFTDVTDPDVLAAYALGITAGVGNRRFNPHGDFTREQAATMIMNACRAIGARVANPPPSGFADMNSAATWARPGINFVRANGIMQGTGNNNFSPQARYTIQEAIVTFNNIRHGDLPR